MLTLSISGLDAIRRGLEQAPQATALELRRTMQEAVLLVEREVRENVPRVSGLTAGSITSDVASLPAGVLGVVGSSQPSALFLELGTRPHMPPVEALQPWVRAVLGISDPKENRSVAFLVARKIARDGTKAQRPFERASQSTHAQVVQMFEAAAGRIAQRLAGNGGAA